MVAHLTEHFGRVPVYVVANEYREIDERNSLRLGVCRYLCKPFGSRIWRDLTAYAKGHRCNTLH